MLREQEVRRKIKALKRFYMDLINFFLVNTILILIWFTFDRTGNFWPKYVILIWAILLIFKAYRMGIAPLIFRTSFLSDDWEEKKTREIMRRTNVHRKSIHIKDKEEK
jgi:hypothetical protein